MNSGGELILVAGISYTREFSTIASRVIRYITYASDSTVLLDLDPKGSVASLLNDVIAGSHPMSAASWLLGIEKLPSPKGREPLHILTMEFTARIPVKHPKRSITQLLKILLRKYHMVIVSSPILSLSILYSAPYSRGKWLIAVLSKEETDLASLMLLHAIFSGFRPASMILVDPTLASTQISTVLGILVVKAPPTSSFLDQDLPLVAKHIAQLKDAQRRESLRRRLKYFLKERTRRDLRLDPRVLVDLLADRVT